MDASIVFTRWRQCALLCGHIGASWRIRLNLCFLRPTRVHNPNSKSICPAIFAQLMAECHWVHWRHLPNTIETVHTSATWQMRLKVSFGPPRVHNLNGKSIGSAVSAQLMAEIPYTVQRAHFPPPKIVPNYGEIWTPS